ncbi:MAG: hypothetical protein E7231_14830 [Cellulosilyticum sp.]|nr:hypothetical protein [Cellulosilyticum sp.]
MICNKHNHKTIVDYVYNNAELCNLLFGKQGNTNFQNSIFNLIEHILF